MVRTRSRARGHLVRACAMSAWLVATVVFASPAGAQQAARGTLFATRASGVCTVWLRLLWEGD